MLKLNFTTLTPLHISNGEQLGYGLDYIQKGESIYKLNPQKVAQKFADKKIFDFNKEYSLNDLINLLKEYENSFNENDSFYVVKADSSFTKLIKNERAIGRKYFIDFINSNGKFYIPASSIKGAILSVLKKDHFGIDANNANINDKFVIHDSDLISQDKFKVYLTNNRPPKIGLLCLEPNIDFSLCVTKYKSLNISDLKKKLNQYAKTQISLAKRSIIKFRAQGNQRKKGADIFYDALENLENYFKNLGSDDYMINIGFGGGSWFKVFENTIPKFPSKSPKRDRKGKDEEPHTTVSFNFDGRTDHIGWCKLKIEEE